MQTRRPDARVFNSPYHPPFLDHIAFPLGGIGAGMICLEGTGALSHVSLRHRPELFHEPMIFSALCIRRKGGNLARVLEGPVPTWKLFGQPECGKGGNRKTYGLPRFARATFQARFPFGTVTLNDPAMPVAVTLTGWSPFTPGDADASSLPVAAIEITIRNRSRTTLDAVYSFHAAHFLGASTGRSVRAAPGGFVLWEPGDTGGHGQQAFNAMTPHPDATVDCAWFRGIWRDCLPMAWQSVLSGECRKHPPLTRGEPSPGASLYVPLRLRPGQTETVKLLLAWHVPSSEITSGRTPAEKRREQRLHKANGCDAGTAAAVPGYRPWYAARFPNISAISQFWRDHYDTLHQRSRQFADCFQDTTLPPEVVEAVSANLCILKSPTVLRQADGRLWGWEGSGDVRGCCAGSCTHVWNYAQSLAHLLPELERSLRETEFNACQDKQGHQNFRAFLPIRPATHDFHAAADGQLGGLLKLYRDWRVSGDTPWLRRFWPRARRSLDFCIATWDPAHCGVIREPHHTTYDLEFWGPDSLCCTLYLGALQAAVCMGQALGEEVSQYRALLAKGRRFVEKQLWNGSYFQQQIVWKGLRAKPEAMQSVWTEAYSPEALALMRREGPKFQYGPGCLSDGVFGEWLTAVCGLDPVLNPAKVCRHLRSVFRYNFRSTLKGHTNVQRPGYALGAEAGLLLCSWPRGGRPTRAMIYADEVWTGIEYAVASHLMMQGDVRSGLAIVRATRLRYDGRIRNPFDEYECGHWYARAMASYGLLQGLTGARYDAVDRTLSLRPSIGGDFRAFFCAASGFGTVGVRRGKPFLDVVAGSIPVERIAYEPCTRKRTRRRVS